jgi:hypothetical protein
LELLIGIPLLIRPAATAEWMIKFMKDDVRLRMVGGVLFVIALLTLVENWSVGMDVAGLVRLVAWITAIKCLTLAWYPYWAESMSERFYSIPAVRPVVGALAWIDSVLCTWAGVILQTAG